MTEPTWIAVSFLSIRRVFGLKSASTRQPNVKVVLVVVVKAIWSYSVL